MKKKLEVDLIFGLMLLIFGSISATYRIISVIINISLVQTGIFMYVKDILFDIIFILLGLILIRKKRMTNLRGHNI